MVALLWALVSVRARSASRCQMLFHVVSFYTFYSFDTLFELILHLKCYVNIPETTQCCTLVIIQWAQLAQISLTYLLLHLPMLRLYLKNPMLVFWLFATISHRNGSSAASFTRDLVFPHGASVCSSSAYLEQQNPAVPQPVGEVARPALKGRAVWVRRGQVSPGGAGFGADLGVSSSPLG